MLALPPQFALLIFSLGIENGIVDLVRLVKPVAEALVADMVEWVVQV